MTRPQAVAANRRRVMARALTEETGVYVCTTYYCRGNPLALSAPRLRHAILSY
jgi:hypothetical protein